MTKKIILLLVEGPTDEDTLALIFSLLIKEYNIEFVVIHTDITASEDITVKYIERAIENEISKYLKRNPFIRKKDILKVIQIIDTDGAFVPNTLVKPSKTGKTEYFETHIEAKNKDRLIRRNISKRSIVHHLSKINTLSNSISFEIYYFSRNLEHVLYDISRDLTDEEKENLAFETADKYSKNPKEFLSFLNNSDFCVKGSYEDTWKYIMENGNSLKRNSNIAVFFDRLGIVV